MMKKQVYILAMGLLLLGSSCTDFLDTKPYDKITGEQTWKKEELAKSFVYSIYSDVLQHNLWLGAYGCVYSCRAESSTKNAMTGTLNSSYWSRDRVEGVTPDDNYEWLNYGVLWRIHTAMKEVSESTVFSEKFKKQTIGELKFLRAAHYFLFARQYGGLQLIDRILSTEDNLKIPRASIKETYDFILKDLGEAAIALSAVNEVERGCANSTAAYALIMRVANQAAAYVDGGSAQSSYYDQVIAAGTALQLTPEGNQLSPYADMFRAYETAISAQEQILVVERIKTNTSLNDTPMQYQGLWCSGNISEYAKEHFPINVTMNFWGMDGGAWPTQDLVDDYLVADVDGTLKYWEDASYVQTGADVDEKMYFSQDKKRDLRFYSTILYDGCMYFNDQVRVFFRRDGNCSNSNSKINEGAIEEYGRKAGDLDNYNSSTGYGMVKYHYDHIVSLPDPGSQKLNYCFSVLRYGEAYLNMAEAYLMKGDFDNARKYMIPTMVKHGGFSAGKAAEYLSDKTGNGWNDPLFEAYKRERNVEMVYENNDRYWSLMRWGMRQSGGVGNGAYATSGFVIPELVGSMRGIRISRDGKTYEFFEDNNAVGEARFSPKRYLVPLNRSFCQKSGVNQNAGWE